MYAASKLNAALIWLADRSVIGFVTAIASLPIATASAALAAGAVAADESSLRAGLPAFWRSYRRFVKSSILASTVSVVLAASAVASFALVAPNVNGVTRAGFEGAGMVSAAAGILLVSYAAVCMHMGVKVTARNIGTLVLLTPGSALQLLLLAVLTVMGLLAFAVAAFPVVGVTVSTVSKVHSRYQRREHSSAGVAEGRS